TQAFVIDTFLWGFGVQTAPNAITPTAPAFFGPPTGSYLATLNSYYSGAPPNPPTSGGTSSKFNFQAGCDNCFRKVKVPEPPSYLLILVGLFGLAGARKIFANG
ncbi:MAG: PEP-CTERM sorting domain-containing protein, partial [Acetobacteraceae bacterium]